MNLSKIFIKASNVDNLLQNISTIIRFHAPDQYDSIMQEIDLYCEDNELNFDNPEYSEYYWTLENQAEIFTSLTESLIEQIRGYK